MNFTHTYSYIIATLLIGIYLTLPITIFVQALDLEVGSTSTKIAYSSTTTAPCDNCPCSGGRSSDCCDTLFCNCGCQAPLGRSLHISYTPMLVVQSFPEPSWSFPEIYRPIFVPPQNIV